jgi:hypothetical protein
MKLGRCEVIGQIGAGGMVAVYCVTDTRLHRDVVV